MSLQPLFEKGKFVVTAEVGPLKGTDTTELMEAVELLKGKVDAANDEIGLAGGLPPAQNQGA